MNVKLIDVLIVETLLHSVLTADELAGMFGEDRTRVLAWLQKLKKLGAVNVIGSMYYSGCWGRVYLAQRRQPIP